MSVTVNPSEPQRLVFYGKLAEVLGIGVEESTTVTP